MYVPSVSSSDAQLVCCSTGEDGRRQIAAARARARTAASVNGVIRRTRDDTDLYGLEFNFITICPSCTELEFGATFLEYAVYNNKYWQVSVAEWLALLTAV